MFPKAIRILRDEGLTGFVRAGLGLLAWQLAQKKSIRDFVANQRVNKKVLPNVSEDFIEYGGAEIVSFEQPERHIRLSNEPNQVSPSDTTYEIPRPYVYKIRNATLLGEYGLTLTNDNKYLFENSINRIKPFTKSYIQTKVSPSFLKKHQRGSSVESAVSLVGPWTSNYFHWFSDYLPRLEGLKVYEERTNERPTIIHPSDPPEWMLDSLHLLGFDRDRLREWQGGRCDIESLIVPSVRRNQWQGYDSTPVYLKAGRKWLRETILENIQSDSELPSRIYVSRSDAPNRRVHNREEVLEVLRHYGFRSFVLSELSLLEQIRLFEGADVLVSPHGAGLTNMLWSTDLNVVEIFGAEDVYTCYFRMARQLGHEYTPIYGEQVGQDMKVDADALREVIEDQVDLLERKETDQP